MAEAKTDNLVTNGSVEKTLSVCAATRRLLASAELRRTVRIALSGFVAGFLLLVISGQLKTMAGEIVAIWVTDGYLLGHTMVLARRHKPVFLFGASIGLLLANLMGDETLYVAFSFTFAGLVETGFATVILPGVKTARELVQPKAFLRFVIGACIVAPALSGVIAVLLLEGIFTSHPFSSFSNWVISDSLGLLIFTPVTLVMLSGEWRSLLKRGNRAKSASLLALVVVVTVLIFSQTSYPSLYWMLPPLALLAFHAELSTVLLGTLLFIVISVPLTVRGTGPLWLFAFPTMQERVLALQVFTVAALSIVLPITVLQTQRNALLALLADGHRRFRQLAEHSEEVVVQLSADGLFQYVSPRATTVLGYEPDMLLGRNILDLVHADDCHQLNSAITWASTAYAEESVQYRVRRADNTYIWVRSFVAAMPAGVPDERAALAFTVMNIDAYVLSEQRRSAEEQKLRDLAFIDSLTGLRNRRYLDSKVNELSQSPSAGVDVRHVAVLFADIDYFKSYNDRYGHQAGDECLRKVGKRIEGTMREADVLARYGGEEFVILLDGCQYAEAVDAAERIRVNIEGLAIAHEGSPLGVVTLSIGVAHANVGMTTSPSQLLEVADSALYEAKRLGRNRVCHKHSVNSVTG
ncbi:sensor domain-containing diguanylate cyclase [Paraburkholderia hospita]|uniref:sensor domain-containing diguanylate cyclase n=1 Tax=Paraburkholderia hospita TaxID=169430 RepID=UPI000B343E78|nr:GGDEF domain-containing protein [Paraburkholderia hospita]OUL75673.1 sensor domain-containing diguanylate cyclase [Paraburkholderia hospita]